MFSRRWFGTTLLVAFFAMPLGCRERDEIQSYAIPKLAETPKEILDTIVEYRIWGVIVPAGDGSSWFFKTQGPVASFSSTDLELDHFAKSIRYPNGLTQNPTWELPPGWTEDRKDSRRIATLTFGPPDKKLQLSITRFQGSLLDNANRWRRMVGADEVKEENLAKAAVPFRTGTDNEAFRVDARGKKDPEGAMRGIDMPTGRN